MSGFHPFGGRVSRHFGDHLDPEDAYLSYHDVRLTKLDVDTIRDDWLTDNAIAFWEEYEASESLPLFPLTVTNRYLEHERLIKYPHANIVLLRPTMTFMLLQTPDATTLRSALPNFTKTTHIFLPINNATSVTVAESGSHWSLLLVSVIDGVAFHYDSLGNDNLHPAATVTNKMATLLNRRLRFIHMRDAPQQENGSDCGIFVCMIMKKLLLERLLNADSTEKVSMAIKGGKGMNPKEERKEMFRIIEGFRKEGERRRSRSLSPLPGSRRDRSGSKEPPRIGDEQLV